MRFLAVLLWGMSVAAVAQQGPPNEPPPRSDDANVSSSKDTKIDMSAPPGEQPLDLSGTDDVEEMRPYDPHRAAKAVEVGEFYLKRGNYRAAESRFREALDFKPHDPAATMLLGSLYEKTQRPIEAFKLYAAYLAGAPGGERAGDAAAGLEKLRPAVQGAGEDPNQLQANAAAEAAEPYFRAKNWPLARERFAEVLRLDPRHTMGLLRMAQILEQVGEFDAAVAGYERFLAVAPEHELAPGARASRERLVKVGAGQAR